MKPEIAKIEPKGIGLAINVRAFVYIYYYGSILWVTKGVCEWVQSLKISSNAYISIRKLNDLFCWLNIFFLLFSSKVTFCIRREKNTLLLGGVKLLNNPCHR